MAKKCPPDQEFQRLVAGIEKLELIPLLMELASDAYPEVDRRGYEAEVERIAEAARAHLGKLPSRASGQRQLKALSEVFCEFEGFRGNFDDYYDPRNSYINEVLRRRTGIPISLGILYLEIGRRCGLPLEGVCAPAHFVVSGQFGGQRWFVDAFHHGDVLDGRECRDRIEQLLGQSHVLTRADLQPASLRQIIVRMLRNLKACYVAANQWHAALPVQQRLVALLPSESVECRDLGLLYLRRGHGHGAFQCLRNYCRNCSETERQALEPYLAQAERLLAEMN